MFTHLFSTYSFSDHHPSLSHSKGRASIKMHLLFLHRWYRFFSCPKYVHHHAGLLLCLFSMIGGIACDSSNPSTSANQVVAGIDTQGSMDMQPTADQIVTTEGDQMILTSYGEACMQDQDCYSDICLLNADSSLGICTVRCNNRCSPFGDRPAFCRFDSSYIPADFLCHPQQVVLCQPCANDMQCDGGQCIEIDGEQRCSTTCQQDQDCSDGYRCDSMLNVCIPKSGTCACNEETAGQTRVCENSNEFGTCLGEETCDPQQGWVNCTAQIAQAEICDGQDQNCNQIIDEGSDGGACMLDNEFGTCMGVYICQAEEGLSCYGTMPQAESCDGVDNDCDQQVDEDFMNEEGRYQQVENCGRCGQNCREIFPTADAVACMYDETEEQASCQITACPAGTQLVNGIACLPLQDVLCESCLDDETCTTLSPGSACIPIGTIDQPETYTTVCGRDCSPNGNFGSTCPDGFVCQRFSAGAVNERQAIDEAQANENDFYQCVPAQGHCLCLENSDLFSVACSIPDPQNAALSCTGQRACVNGDFGDCIVPADTCDGIDNDCDGQIDNAYRDEQGRYTLDPQHCGRCFRDCNSLVYPNADAVCNTQNFVYYTF